MCWFARPCFRIVVCCGAKPRQAGFCPCTQRQISDLPEPTIGRPCYFFEGVAPHPNCPSIGVLHAEVSNTILQGQCSRFDSEVGWRLLLGNVSCLLSTNSIVSQRQTAVKLHGVFAFRWKVLDCAPVCQFHRLPGGDSRALVGPSCKPPIKRQGITLP